MYTSLDWWYCSISIKILWIYHITLSTILYNLAHLHASLPAKHIYNGDLELYMIAGRKGFVWSTFWRQYSPLWWKIWQLSPIGPMPHILNSLFWHIQNYTWKIRTWAPLDPSSTTLGSRHNTVTNQGY